MTNLKRCTVCSSDVGTPNKRGPRPDRCWIHRGKASRQRGPFWLPPHGIGTCAWCGDWFGRKQPEQRTCGIKCARRLQYQVAAKYRSDYRSCSECGGEFQTSDQRKQYCGRDCKARGREQPPQTNAWLLANKPQLPTEPCLNCDAPVVQYRQRRKDGDMRYCSTGCRPHAPLSLADWPPKIYGRTSAVRSGCPDCNTRQAGGRCKRHGDKRALLLKQLRTRINWLLPRACLNCNREFNRFDQGGVCDACHAKVRSATKAKRRARIAGALRKDEGICHQELHRIFNGTCQLCGNKTQPPEVWIGWDGKTPMPYAPTVDHIIPLAKAGTHTWDNVQLAHALCNSFKNAS